jgi:hypothetical protein
MAPGESEHDLSRPVESGISARVILIAGICPTAGMEGPAVATARDWAVFDWRSRTTPAGGAEWPSFVR